MGFAKTDHLDVPVCRSEYVGGGLFGGGSVTVQLKEDYVFLRRIEHFLQILEDRQIHVLPMDPAELDALAKKMLGPEADAAGFLEGLDVRLQRINDAYETYLLERRRED